MMTVGLGTGVCDLTTLDWEDQDQGRCGLVLSSEGVGRTRHHTRRPNQIGSLGQFTVMATIPEFRLSACNEQSDCHTRSKLKQK